MNISQLLQTQQYGLVWYQQLLEATPDEQQKLLSQVTQDFQRTYTLFCYLYQYTLITTDETKKRELKRQMREHEIVLSAKEYKDSLKVSTCLGDITLKNLKDTFSYFQRDNNIGNDSLEKTECHQKAIEIGTRLKTPCQVVTGFIHGPFDKIKILHSWLETSDGKYVIDYTINAIMNKEGYYLLRNPQVLNRLNTDTIREDLQALDPTLEYNLLEYLINHETFMQSQKSKKMQS